MSKVDELVNKIRSNFNTCVDSVRNQELFWEDYAMIALPKERLSSDEITELVERINFTHYYRWANVPDIIKAFSDATSIMVYVDDTSSWWRFEA